MKKILVIHNKYRLRGGEDIAVEKEVELLKEFYEVQVLNYHNRIENIFSQLFSFLSNENKTSINELRDKLDSFNPDIAYVHNTWFKASLGIFKLLKSRDIRIILKLHNFRYDCTNNFSLRKHLKGESFCAACGIENKNYRFFNKYFQDSYLKSFFVVIYGKKFFEILKNQNLSILVLTDFHKKYLQELGIKESKISIFPNYINMPISNNHKYADEYIIYAGRVSKEKGLEELITTFLNAQINNMHLKVVGDGPQLKSLQKKYKHKSIKFLGQKNNEEVYELISKSKSVITATKLYEGQPMLLCEASLIGVPSIYPRSGGIKEFFPESSHFSFEQFNYHDLQDKIEFLQNNDDTIKEASKNKDHIVKYLDKDSLLKKFERIIND
jgi:glycosyltransferase involved in cell wall biosynthesis